MGSCNIKQNDKPLYISFTPKTSIFSSNNYPSSLINSEFIHSFNPSKTKSNSSRLIMNNFLRNDTHHTSSSVNSSDTLTSEDSFCSFDSEILNYFKKEAKHNTKKEPSAMYYKVKSKNSSDENQFVMYNHFNNQRGDKVSFNKIPSLPLEHIKQPIVTVIESPKMFIRKDAMKDTHMLSSAAPVNCPKKEISLTFFSEETSYKTLSSISRLKK